MLAQRFIPTTLLLTSLLNSGCWVAPPESAHAAVVSGAVLVHDVQVTHDHYTAHVQPSIAVNPRDPRNLLVTALLFRSQHGPYVGSFASFNGGRTWRDNGPLQLPRGTSSSDVPSVAFDSHGTALIVGTAVNTAELNVGSDQHTCVCLWRSNDDGRTFRHPIAVSRGQAVDHPWIAVARRHGTIYVVWRSKRPDGIAFSRSIDGGYRFTTSRIIAHVPNGGAYAPMVAAGSGDSLFVVYDGQTNSKTGRGKQGATYANQRLSHIDVVRSTDGGHHFSRPTQLATAPESLSPAPHVSILSPPEIAVGPKGRSIYVTYAGFRASTRATDILLRRSLDGGRTWHVPVPVTNGPAARSIAVFQPAVAVDGTGGVDVSFLGLAGGRTDVWLARSVNPGRSFRSDHRLTAPSFNPALGLHQGGAGSSWWIGDYQGLAAGGAMIHPIWSDTRTGRLEVYTAAVSVDVVH
jgi:hypothetical protein